METKPDTNDTDKHRTRLRGKKDPTRAGTRAPSPPPLHCSRTCLRSGLRCSSRPTCCCAASRSIWTWRNPPCSPGQSEAISASRWTSSRPRTTKSKSWCFHLLIRDTSVTFPSEPRRRSHVKCAFCYVKCCVQRLDVVRCHIPCLVLCPVVDVYTLWLL